MILQTENEIKNLLYYAWSTLGVKGDIFEAGVYRGGSAKVLDTLKGNRKLYLFDSFGPNHDGIDDLFNQDGALEEVKLALPEALINVPYGQLSMAHLDLDGYGITLEVLAKVYTSMTAGGAILFHDYQNTGLRIKEAVDKFFSDKVEKPTALTDTTQCVVIKL